VYVVQDGDADHIDPTSPMLFFCNLVRALIFVRSFNCLFVQLFVRSVVRSIFRSFVRSFVRLFVRLFVVPFVRPFVRAFVRVFVRLLLSCSTFLSMIFSPHHP
jgi:hypothetical protein